ncbi:MAG: C40 family peptidase [Lentimicrobium sp.]|nr:C40 family peptidase [Lentimicrobium sp.]
MHFKLSIIALIVLFTNCFQSSDKALPEKLPVKKDSIDRTEVIEFAKAYLGTTYRYASSDPALGFDCSGFVHFVFKNFDINLPRGSAEYKFLGTALKPEEFKEGDVLVFYGNSDSSQIGHVGIICEANGMKSKFIHASSGKANGVTISELGSDHYTRRFYKCIDVIDLVTQ